MQTFHPRQPRRSGAVSLCSVALAIVFTLAGTSDASPVQPAPGGAAAEAEAAIRRGVELRRAGKDEAALPEFQSAYELARSPRSSAQLGLCNQALGRWVEAEDRLEEALDSPSDAWVSKNRRVLQDALAIIKKHIGRVEVLGEPEGAEVRVAGRVVGRLPLAKAVRVEEGSVDVDLSASGYRRASRTLNVAAGQHQRIVLRAERLADTPSSSVALSSSSAASGSPRGQEVDVASTTPPLAGQQSIFRNKWLWGTAVVVVAAAVAAGVVLVGGGSTYPRVSDTVAFPASQ